MTNIFDYTVITSMARHSLLDRYETFVSCAVLGAHVNGRARGFRQNDVRFMIEVFTNWVESAEENPSLPVQNTQISRYLDNLIDEGFARAVSEKSFPRYRLTRTGVIEMMSRIVHRPYFNQREHFYFVFYFIDTYKPQLIRLVKREGSRFPFSLQVELDSLLDVNMLLDRQLEYAQRAIHKLNRRIEEAQKTARTVRRLVTAGTEYSELLEELEREAPMDLTTSRRYTELYARVTERQGIWEMTIGNDRRVSLVWMPARRQLEQHILELEHLKNEH
ncbi:MAG: hypothetical protein KDD66_01755 [Bdellovibrionales bacterium]|nr:hypothetical protein [Bdellovibrionales bacterium]